MGPRRSTDTESRDPRAVTLFLSGDVMTGRGIDQILPNPSEPWLVEPCVSSALEYVESAESVTGPLPRHVSFDYVWGDALSELQHVRPAARIVNLETAVTASPEAWPQKEIHYRMHPANVPCLNAARMGHIERGAELFRTCIVCHGSEGEGNPMTPVPAIFPSLLPRRRRRGRR